MIFKVNYSEIQYQTRGDVFSTGVSNSLDGMFDSILGLTVLLFLRPCRYVYLGMTLNRLSQISSTSLPND